MHTWCMNNPVQHHFRAIRSTSVCDGFIIHEINWRDPEYGALHEGEAHQPKSTEVRHKGEEGNLI